MPRARRLGRLIALTVALVAAFASDAAAHGGTVIASGENDAYTVTVQAADTRTPGGAPAVDLTAYPIRRANGAPETGATVTFRIDGGPEQTGKLVSGAYDVIVPVERAGEWRGWAVTVRVTGPAGALTVRRAAGAGAEASPDAPGWVVPTIVGSALGALALVAIRRRGARSRSRASNGSGG
ncbi:hypothetical protein [Conexibacter woesei]|uniref:YtkA-like domain-containing protein n=1 Tax=Conexibacter woesei (strain DSM 14684 / CCUG 47730 / CIP 108061 / JCM 11494 / NBRC 100937 / ID131577) TaxID=469383 RepID=D3F6B3_CONWI|nr:hypothetical protein [Conexibacter woesei]ADB50680.1 hypothetical protein Cwoe_2255 [Conexibacter woesei DSM 14684]